MTEQLKDGVIGFESHSLRQTPSDSVAVAHQNGEKSAKTGVFLYPKFTPKQKTSDMRAYKREWMARRRKEWFDANGPCTLCGSSENLELDHIDPADKTSHKIWSWSKPRREAELAKCRVLCRICHQSRHAAERSSHGVGNYKRGCRCDICRMAKREEKRRYRARRLGLR